MIPPRLEQMQTNGESIKSSVMMVTLRREVS
jgi:hypothetical protein